MIIYCIRNKINRKCYIGKSSFYNSNEEFQKSNYWGSGTYIQRAIQKYGLENFEKWVLIHCKNEQANFYEILWVRKLKTKSPNGYNLTDGGDGCVNSTIEVRKKLSDSNKGHIVSEKTREKISNSKRGQKYGPVSEITKNKIREKLIGVPKSIESVEKIRLSKLGKKLSEAHKKSIGLGQKGKIHSLEWKNNQKTGQKEYYIHHHGNRLGIKDSEETRQKKKQPKSEEHKQAISKAMQQEETKNKVLLSMSKKINCCVCGIEIIRTGFNQKKCPGC
jgi:group I intron endonuclease